MLDFEFHSFKIFTALPLLCQSDFWQLDMDIIVGMLVRHCGYGYRTLLYFVFLISNLNFIRSITYKKKIIRSVEGCNPSAQGVYKRGIQLGRKRTQIQKPRKLEKRELLWATIQT